MDEPHGLSGTVPNDLDFKPGDVVIATVRLRVLSVEQDLFSDPFARVQSVGIFDVKRAKE
jgi:hypothetical protein